MVERDIVIHLLAGGVSGTVAAIITCPLEVVKTRLQSSSGGGFYPPPNNKELGSGHVTCRSYLTPQQRRRLCTGEPRRYSLVTLSHCSITPPPGGRPHNAKMTPNFIKCIKYILEHEGPKALFKGLVPNLIGVAPSRAIYFCAYDQAKKIFNTRLRPDSLAVHMGSAFCAGFISCTATNPIWFIKTRLQLNNHTSSSNTLECIRKVYQQSGVMGFYKGIVASYIGISETVMHFVVYEALKAWLIDRRSRRPYQHDDPNKTYREFIEFMGAGAISKFIASTIAYPHEVVRTRLREEGTKYRRLVQTTNTIVAEEGPRGLYKGFVTQLIRQIPNTAIMMATYELVVYLMTKRAQSTGDGSATESSTSTQFYAEAKVEQRHVA